MGATCKLYAGGCTYTGVLSYPALGTVSRIINWTFMTLVNIRPSIEQ